MSIIQLIHGDCLEKMKDIPDGSIDLILTDPPFGVTACTWDSIIPFELVWEVCKKVSNSTCVTAIFGSQPFTTKLISSNESNFRYCWYWIKNQCTNFFHAKRMPLRKVEEISVFYRGNYFPQKTTGHPPTNSAKGCSNGKLYHGSNKRNYKGGDTDRYPVNVLYFDCVDNYSRVHPNQKPVDLLEYLIQTYTKEGDTVLDFTMGAGSTGIACLNTNRNFIGIEKDIDYFNIASARINNHE